MKKTSTLTALSPLEGRYAEALEGFGRECFSEYALIRNRILVEAEWFKVLCIHKDIGGGTAQTGKAVNRIVEGFTENDAQAIKRIEKRTNHDMKAVEYWMREKLKGTPLKRHSSLLHFGCTSWDINNLAQSLMLRKAVNDWLLPPLQNVHETLRTLAAKYATLPMLARTHGQPASPTTLGKELAVHSERLRKQILKLRSVKLEGKMSGAVGSYNAHVAAYPKVNWLRIAKAFVEDLGFTHNPLTTQIEPYDSIAELFDCISRINVALTDLCQDAWTYISLDYLRQKPNKGEVGSSTMPHKVNPIDFENAEGNFGISSSLFRHFSASLPTSRLQRDLTDSTVVRNIGVAFGHAILALKSLAKGLGKVSANTERMAQDLDANWQVLAEAVMSVLKSCGHDDGYEIMKTHTRGKGPLDRKELHRIIRNLPLPQEKKARLLKLTPCDYVGLSGKLAGFC